MIISTVLLLAQNDLGDGHMDWDGGWWIVMAFGMVIFWGLVIVGIVWLVRELGGSHRHAHHEPDALAVLDRRLADGSISTEEYRERRAILTGTPPGSGSV
jgi:putative membrane protein